MNKECGTCIKRKTMLCPNSSECYNTKDKPYYRETDSDFEIELIEENKQLKKQIDYIRSGEYFNQLRFERNMLEDLIQNGEVSKEDKEFIDCTHRNTELLEENKQLQEKISLLNKMNEENYEKYCNELKKNKKAIDNLKEPYLIECEQQCRDVIEILEGDNKDE